MQKSTDSRNLKLFWTKIILFISLIGLGIVLDRILKFIAANKLPDMELFVLPKYFAFILHENLGMAFGIRLPIELIIILGLIILVILGILAIYSIKHRNLNWFYPLTLILAGGASNLYDRIFYGYTIDYFYLRPYSFFNIADILIITGCIIIFIHSIKSKQHKLGHAE